MSLSTVSVATLTKLLGICSSTVPWLGVVWIRSSPYSSGPLLWHQLLLNVMFPSVSVVLNFCVFLVSFACQRNGYRFCSKPPSAVGLIASIKGCLSFYLPLLFKRFRSRRRRLFFQLHWGAFGCIGKVVGDSFHLCLSQSECVSASPLVYAVAFVLAVLWSVSIPLCPPRSPLVAVLRFSWL